MAGEGVSNLLAPAVVIVDVDCGLAQDEIIKVCGALTRQSLEHAAPAFGTMLVYRTPSVDGPQRPGEWRMELRKTPTIEDALGFHDRAEDGTPILYVFPELCKQTGTSWSSCASHEGLEAQCDPYLCTAKMAPGNIPWAYEVCDACENETYLIDGVEVSDFCLPAWFEPRPGATTGSEQYDYLGRCKAPFQILAGGYGQVYDATKGWVTKGAMRAYRAEVAALGLSRGVRRATR